MVGYVIFYLNLRLVVFEQDLSSDESQGETDCCGFSVYSLVVCN